MHKQRILRKNMKKKEIKITAEAGVIKHLKRNFSIFIIYYDTEDIYYVKRHKLSQEYH